ncbi:hypothetical protein EVAR_98947_1 [Eumeta japonica]|uniref:Uncharacterized protein n=1 Tax=Eumeta variegata TaxID=151549 RepID=A0A4C2AHB8_EUMVA|nr:hypothetical protein EVAR_98947_1 [Eumeta japonica]
MGGKIPDTTAMKRGRILEDDEGKLLALWYSGYHATLLHRVTRVQSPQGLKELPTISKYMKDASKRFFDIAGYDPVMSKPPREEAHWDVNPNALLRAVVYYQPPPPTHLIRRPRNVPTDPSDTLTALS